MTREQLIHVGESLALTFLGGFVGFVEPVLTSYVQTGHLTADPKAIASAAIGAGFAAIVARIRGYQFGVPRGVALASSASEQPTPAETPVSKGNVQ